MSWFRLTLLTIFLAGCTNEPAPEPLDVVLAGGTVFSGADAEPVVADIGISGDRIIAIGDLGDRSAALRLDVAGLAVMPGIIDIHSHAIRAEASGSGIYRWPDAENLIRQGVTTVIGGPDGGSPLPLETDFRRLEESPASVNYGSFVGHGSVRQLVVGDDDILSRPETVVVKGLDEDLADPLDARDPVQQQRLVGLHVTDDDFQLVIGVLAGDQQALEHLRQCRDLLLEVGETFRGVAVH